MNCLHCGGTLYQIWAVWPKNTTCSRLNQQNTSKSISDVWYWHNSPSFEILTACMWQKKSNCRPLILSKCQWFLPAERCSSPTDSVWTLVPMTSKFLFSEIVGRHVTDAFGKNTSGKQQSYADRWSVVKVGLKRWGNPPSLPTATFPAPSLSPLPSRLFPSSPAPPLQLEVGPLKSS